MRVWEAQLTGCSLHSLNALRIISPSSLAGLPINPLLSQSHSGLRPASCLLSPGDSSSSYSLKDTLCANDSPAQAPPGLQACKSNANSTWPLGISLYIETVQVAPRGPLSLHGPSPHTPPRLSLLNK